MMLTNRQSQLFSLGCQVRAEFNMDSVKAAIRCAMQNDFCVEDIMDAIDSSDNLFFDAGITGYTPEWRVGYRYGEIPADGKSTNWATGEQERGVSCTALDNDKPSIYDHIYGLQDIKKIKIAGWYTGAHGSDGEPLLINPIKVEEE